MKKLIYTLVILAFVSSISAQWVSQTNPVPAGSNMAGKIQFVSAAEGWISLGNGKLLHTINGGNNWVVVNPEPVDTLFSWSDPAVSISFINASTGWIIRTKGSFSQMNGAVVYKTSNGGVNWSKVTIPIADAGMFIQFTDASNGWILIFNSNFTSGGFYRTTNGGTSWNNIYPPVGGFPFFVNSNTGWLMPSGTGGSGTTSDTIRKTTNGGVNWTAPWGTNAQVRFSAIHFSDENNGWAVGRNRLFLKTTNGGNSWAYVTNTSLDDSAYSKCVFFVNANTGWIGANYYVPPPQQSPARVLLFTSNGGNSWTQQIPSFLTWQNAVFSIYFTNAQNGWFTADIGVIGQTTNGGGAIGIEPISNEIPSSFSLHQNYPNPFNPVTKIRFDIPKSDFVSLKIVDILGREIAALVDEQLKAGTYQVDWDAGSYPSGVYFYKLTTNEFTNIRKMILIK